MRNVVYTGRFPPSFDDSSLVYAGALFGLAMITGCALAILVGYLCQSREAAREAPGNIYRVRYPKGINVSPRRTEWTLYELYRFKICALLVTILLGAAPDVLVLLAWGEVSDPTMFLLFQADRICDFVALFPFMGFVCVYVASGQAVGHALSVDERTADFTPAIPRLRDKLGIAFWSLLIAAGVTLYKANVAG
jgi:hypothetical protein